MKGIIKSPLKIPAFKFVQDDALFSPPKWPGRAYNWKKRPVVYKDNLPVFWTDYTGGFLNIFFPDTLSRVASPRKFGRKKTPIIDNARSVILAEISHADGTAPQTQFDTIISTIGASVLDKNGISLYTQAIRPPFGPLAYGVPFMDTETVSDIQIDFGLPSATWTVPVPKSEQFIAGETLIIYGTPLSTRLFGVRASWYSGSYASSDSSYSIATQSSIRARDAASVRTMIDNSKRVQWLHYFPADAEKWLSSDSFNTGFTNEFVPVSPILSYSNAKSAMDAAIADVGRPQVTSKLVGVTTTDITLPAPFGVSSNGYIYDAATIAQDIKDFFNL
jgi:hypothetical protein